MGISADDDPLAPAGQRGGGIRISSCNVEIVNCTITGNKAESGGGIYADKSTVTVAEGGAVQGNKASMGGGIYMNASSAAVAKGSALYNNKAAYGGDDLFAFGDNTLSLPDAKSMSGDRKPVTARSSPAATMMAIRKMVGQLVGRRRKMALLTMISMTLKRVLPTMRSRLRTA